MAEPRGKLERAAGAMRDDVWDDIQHRRIGKRLDEALAAPRRRPRSWLAAAGAAVAVAAVVAVFWLRPTSMGSGVGGAASAQLQSARTVLADGSVVDVERGGQIQVVSDRAEETRVEVLKGRAELEVQKRPDRPFIVGIRGVEVRVVGTHFSTELDEGQSPAVVRVVVSRGIVEVRGVRGEPVARLKAGDKIELALPSADGAKAPEPVTPVEPPSAPEPGISAARSAAPAPDAAKLFEMAHDARSAGDIQGATRAYALLLKQFPSDSRVGVAALELGRLRMDSQHAYGPAAVAFRRAFSAAPSEGIREDALARLVEALDAMGDQAGCSTEQQRYHARYPTGVHAASVLARCGKH